MLAFAATDLAPLNLSRRSTEAESLDDSDLHPAELERVLRDLARFNGAMFGRQLVISWLARAADNVQTKEPLTVIDVGCGYGDLLRAIRCWARRRSLALKLIGLDVSQEIIRIARAATDPIDQIDYQVANVFDFKPAAPVDFAVSSLVTHHLSDKLIIKFLQWMEVTARRGWLICDLHRHVVPYHFMKVAGVVLRLDPLVVHDGRISVARSLTRNEGMTHLAAADIPREAIDLRWFLFRFLIGRMS